MTKLRQYQRDAANAAWIGFREYRKQLAVLPTGSGKTVIFAKMAAHPGLQPALILCHREELIDQAVDKLSDAGCGGVSVEKAARHGSIGSPVVVASMQTMAGISRLADWPPDHFKFVVVDEAHHSLSPSWRVVIDHFPEAKILGVTATPHRGDRKNLGKIFENICYEISLLDLVKQGFLCRIKVRTVPLKIDLSKVRKVAGDFADKESGALLEPLLKQIGASIKYYAGNRKSLIFLPLRQTSRMLCSVLQDLGLNAEHIDGEDPLRKEKLENFRSGRTTHLCNAMLLTEGYDEPSIECIVPLRPTASQPLYAQMVGRGTRVHPGKPDLLLLDFLWLHEKHTLIRPAHLIAKTSEIAAVMTGMTERYCEDGDESGSDDSAFDLEALHDSALHEREETLRRQLVAKANRKSKLVDALEYSLDVGEVALAEYEPEMEWEGEPPTSRQLDVLAKMGIAPASIKCKGHATKIMSAIFFRSKMGLATAKQVYWLTKMKHPSPHTATEVEASSFLSKRWSRTGQTGN